MHHNSMANREREEKGSQREPKGRQMVAKGVPEGNEIEPKGSQREPNGSQLEAKGSQREAVEAMGAKMRQGVPTGCQIMLKRFQKQCNKFRMVNNDGRGLHFTGSGRFPRGSKKG